MKRSFAVIMALLVCLSLLAGCNNNSGSSSGGLPSGESSAAPNEAPPAISLPGVVRVAALSGPTAMGMVKLMDDAENEATSLSYEFTIGTTDEIVVRVANGDLDIAALPANLASVLYNNTDGRIQVMAINTLGVLYVVEKGSAVQSAADLSGAVIMSAGKGATPEYALNYVLMQNGIDPTGDITIEYKSEVAEIIPLLVQSEGGIALLPQPFVANALNKVEGLRIALDWTAEWDKVSDDGSSLVTGIIVVQREFAEKYPDAVALFLQEYQASTAYAQTDVSATAELVGKYGIVDAAIAEQALPYCNITYIAGMDMKGILGGYLNVLFEQNAQSVGGTLPDEGFYYIP